MRALIAGLIASIFSAGPALASAESAWEAGVDHFYNFEFDKALERFRESVRSSEPSDRRLEYQYWLSEALWVRMLDQQIDVNQDFMAAVLEKNVTHSGQVSKELKLDFSTVTNSGIEWCEQRLRTSPQDLGLSYYLAAFRSNLGAYELLVEGRRFAALSQIKRAMLDFRRVLEHDRTRVQALTLLGLGHYMVGTNPWYIRMFNPILGLEGNKGLGLEELEEASKKGNVDAKFILKSVLIREERHSEALVLLRDLSTSYPRNISFRLQLAKILSRSGQKDQARRIFQEVLERLKIDKTVDPRYTVARVEALARECDVELGRRQ